MKRLQDPTIPDQSSGFKSDRSHKNTVQYSFYINSQPVEINLREHWRKSVFFFAGPSSRDKSIYVILLLSHRITYISRHSLSNWPSYRYFRHREIRYRERLALDNDNIIFETCVEHIVLVCSCFSG